MGTNKNTVTGYVAGIAAGVSYGMNPLFARPLLLIGVPVMSMLFYRYIISVLIMGVWMLLRNESFKVTWRELRLLALLGVLFASSSLFLFEAYRFIPSGLATTVVYLYPVLVAMIMATQGVHHNWRTWMCIVASFCGVVLLCKPEEGGIHLTGMILSALSALSYALYLVIVNRSERIRHISDHTLTFYAMSVGSIMFLMLNMRHPQGLYEGLESASAVSDLIALAVFPTMIALLTLAMATRAIGPTKTSVLGVFEPVTAITVGTLFFGEPFTRNIAAGLAICIGAVLFLIVSEHDMNRPVHRTGYGTAIAGHRR